MERQPGVRREIVWERRAAFVATTGLVAALLIALIGYIVLLGFDRATGTLDNLVSLAIGSVAGGTIGAGASSFTSAARRRADDGMEEEPPWPPPIPEGIEL